MTEKERVQGFKDSRGQVEKAEGRRQRADDSRQPIAVSQKDRRQEMIVIHSNS
ncbi:MAG TPA: hypothetical protein PK966_10725 [Syntrophorhabdaceae bacterium]|jgi:hypothetical protein|nr:hypothetical protein [Syntrophorhabdaceae bacterium]